jgi:hypothetical protein
MSTVLELCSFSIDDFIYKSEIPETCCICGSKVWPLAQYLSNHQQGTFERGEICKNCIPKLVLRIVNETTQNISAAQNRADCDKLDLWLDNENSKAKFEEIVGNLSNAPEREHNVMLVLEPLSPAFLFHKVRGKGIRCNQCRSNKVLLSFMWFERSHRQRGVCCHSCAFRFCSTLLGWVLQCEHMAQEIDE